MTDFGMTKAWIENIVELIPEKSEVGDFYLKGSMEVCHGDGWCAGRIQPDDYGGFLFIQEYSEIPLEPQVASLPEGYPSVGEEGPNDTVPPVVGHWFRMRNGELVFIDSGEDARGDYPFKGGDWRYTRYGGEYLNSVSERDLVVDLGPAHAAN